MQKYNRLVRYLRGEYRQEVLIVRETNKENRDDKSDTKIVMINNPKHSSNRVHHIEGICPTINTVHDGKIISIEQNDDYNDTSLRRLTHIECERLQGYPDDYTKYGTDNNKKVLMTDRQRYKQLGNSVTVNVIDVIIKNIDNMNNETKNIKHKTEKEDCEMINKTIKLDSW